MELEKSFLYTHLGHSVYSDIEKIDNAIDLIVESMIAYKDNELKKLRVTDVSESVCYCGKPSVEECEPCCSLACALKPKMYR
jgi:hypothetical protein